MELKLDVGVVKFRLGIFAPEPNGGRSLSRLFGPMNLMTRDDPRLELVRPAQTEDGKGWDMDWNYYGGLDAAYFLDPHTAEDLAKVMLARSVGCRVWVDYIDNILNVPPSNPVWPHFAHRHDVRVQVERIMEAADITTTTTETLRQVLPKPDRSVVLPESCRWGQCPFPRQRVVSWRGLSSHAEDVEVALDGIRELSRLPQFSKWQWAFFGDVPWKVLGTVPKENMVIVPAQTPYQWMAKWGAMAPYVHIAPLVDHPFNRCKTPLVWLEASAVGAAVIGPSLPEWGDCPGLISYRDSKDFTLQLRRAMEMYNKGAFHPGAEVSREAIYPNKTTAVVNELRWAILNKLWRLNQKGRAHEMAGQIEAAAAAAADGVDGGGTAEVVLRGAGHGFVSAGGNRYAGGSPGGELHDSDRPEPGAGEAIPGNGAGGDHVRAAAADRGGTGEGEGVEGEASNPEQEERMTGKLLAEAAQDSAPDAAVTIVEHPKGFLLRLEHAGASMTLDRAEAFNLHEKLSAKLGGMPTQL